MKTKKIAAILLACGVATSGIMPLMQTAFATGISIEVPTHDETDWYYVPKSVGIEKGEIKLLAYAKGEFGAFYVEPDKDSEAAMVQNEEYPVRYLGEDGDFYIGMMLDTLKIVYLPKDQSRVYSEKISHVVRKAGTYTFADSGTPPTLDIQTSGTGDAATTSATLIDPGTPSDYSADKHLNHQLYFVRPQKGKTVTVTITDSKDKADDGTFTSKRGILLGLDGTETVKVKNGEIISGLMASPQIVLKMAKKHPTRFRPEKTIEFRYDPSQEYAFPEDLMMLIID